MIILERISQAKSRLQEEKKRGCKIAFVPTMGALHEGHLNLIRQAKQYGDIVVVSIFVNKAQFNDPVDFTKYPRQLDKDLAKLKTCEVDYVFTPQDQEIYSYETGFIIPKSPFVDCLCGKNRAGHFEAVMMIVSKLFRIVEPDFALFGEKDFQQLTIIKKMVQDLKLKLDVIGCLTTREENGLAMSSRNQNLSDLDRKKAANIFKILGEIKEEVREGKKIISEILREKKERFLELNFEKIDYLEIRNEKNFALVNEAKFSDLKQESLRIFAAVYLSQVRLIDNLAI